MTSGSTSLADDQALLIEAVREAGAIVLSYIGNKPKTWKKSPGHWVS